MSSDLHHDHEYLVFTMSNPYGFQYFDKSLELNDEDEDESDEFDTKSCPSNCCDNDCECDDCVRCSKTGLAEPESYDLKASAA